MHTSAVRQLCSHGATFAVPSVCSSHSQGQPMARTSTAGGIAALLAACSLSCTQAFFGGSMKAPLGVTREMGDSNAFPCGIGYECTDSARSHRARHVLFMGRRAAKIAARKGKSDALKTKIYASFGKKIIIAVKAGGPDPEANRALSVVISQAKASGVPNDNIQRAISRGSSANEADFKEAVYEAYGYGGVGLIITCLTDNTNRAKTEINNAIKKTDVKLASSGSVSFNFVKKGLLEVGGKLDEDRVLEAALEADVDDFEIKVDEEENSTNIYLDPSTVVSLRDVLIASGLEIRDTKLVNVPTLKVDCSDEDLENNARVIEALEELDDVERVDHNMNDEDE